MLFSDTSLFLPIFLLWRTFSKYRTNKKCAFKGANVLQYAIVTSFIRTIPSVKELHLVGTLCVFADYTAGEDLHLALKHSYSTPVISHCQVRYAKTFKKSGKNTQ